MKITIGKDYFEARNGSTLPVVWDSQKLINAHVLIVGASGVGKSHTIRKMIHRAELSAQGKKVRFHVFDVHGDLEIPGASVVQFSESAPFGLNPLIVNPDPHFGGVRKCIQNFIRTINQSGAKEIGHRQEAVISNLLIDVYREFDFDIDNVATWGLNGAQTRLAGGGLDNRLYLEVPFAEKDDARALGARWDGHKKLWWVHTEKYSGELTRWKPAFKLRNYPTIEDVLGYANRVYLERYLGTDQRAVLALTEVNKRAQAYQRKLLSAVRHKSWAGEELDVDSREALEEARKLAVEAFSLYAESVQTGRELESLIKYDSPDILKSVVDRLNNLKRTGIFKSTPAPFDEKKSVWRYKINPLSPEEKKLLVFFSLREIYTKAFERGDCDDVVEVVVLDELGTYTSNADNDDGDGIIGTICREARKFGLAFWGATQSPSTVPESLLSSTGTKIILGLDESHWRAAETKLRIESRLLSWVSPHKTMAAQMKEVGELKNRWRWVALDDKE